MAQVALKICPRVALVALRTYHLLDHLSCNDCCPIPRCPSICICIGICIFWQHCLCSNAASARSSVLPCLLPHFYSPLPTAQESIQSCQKLMDFLFTFSSVHDSKFYSAVWKLYSPQCFQPLHTSRQLHCPRIYSTISDKLILEIIFAILQIDLAIPTNTFNYWNKYIFSHCMYIVQAALSQDLFDL